MTKLQTLKSSLPILGTTGVRMLDTKAGATRPRIHNPKASSGFSMSGAVMKEVRFRFLESDVERVIAEKGSANTGDHSVEIVSDGCRPLIFIDGKRLHKVLAINVPSTPSEICPVITLRLVSDKITVRRLDGSQFKDIMAAAHPGERIIPAADNACRMNS